MVAVNHKLLSGMLAISNMGLVIDKSRVTRCLGARREQPNAGNYAIDIGSEYIESTDIENAFVEEAEGWYNTIKDDKLEDIVELYRLQPYLPEGWQTIGESK